MRVHEQFPPPRLMEYLRWVVVAYRVKWWEGYLELRYRLLQKESRIRHLEKLIMQNHPKEDWYSVYGIIKENKDAQLGNS